MSMPKRYGIYLIWKRKRMRSLKAIPPTTLARLPMVRRDEMRQITIGTRASKLAMAQTYQVIERLQRKWPNLQVSIEQIRTVGDLVTDVPLSQIGGDGVFVTEIERALQEKRIDLAVHSLKDLPTVQPQGLCLLVVGPREDAVSY